VIKAEATAPPPTSRIYGIAAVALYEAVVPGAVPQPKKHGKYY
jgi:hypothetical protein